MTDEVAILRVLGRLEAKVDNLAEDQREDREQARESRGRIHERMDEFASSIGQVQSEIRVSAGIDAQVRVELDGLAKRIKEHEPAVNDMRKLRLGLMMLGGALVASGVTLAAAGEAAASAVRGWLKL
jgi:uncharacterized membrane protein